MIPTTYLLSDTARLLRKAFDGRVRQLGMTSPPISRATGTDSIIISRRQFRRLGCPSSCAGIAMRGSCSAIDSHFG